MHHAVTSGQPFVDGADSIGQGIGGTVAGPDYVAVRCDDGTGIGLAEFDDRDLTAVFDQHGLDPFEHKSHRLADIGDVAGFGILQWLTLVGPGLFQEIDLQSGDAVILGHPSANAADVVADRLASWVEDVELPSQPVVMDGRVSFQRLEHVRLLAQQQGCDPQDDADPRVLEPPDSGTHVGEFNGIGNPVAATGISAPAAILLPAVVDEYGSTSQSAHAVELTSQGLGVDVLQVRIPGGKNRFQRLVRHG